MANERLPKLSPAEKRLMAVLLASKAREAPIDELFVVMQTSQLPGTKRVLHQIVGSCVGRINKKLARLGRPECVKPGKARYTYRIWASLKAYEKWKRERVGA